jgi:HNH endonuclease
MPTDVLERVRTEINTRLQELDGVVSEAESLERALAVLGGIPTSSGGRSARISLALSRTGERLLAGRRRLPITARLTLSVGGHAIPLALPVAHGGATTLQNLQLLCADCNRRKSDSI